MPRAAQLIWKFAVLKKKTTKNAKVRGKKAKQNDPG